MNKRFLIFLMIPMLLFVVGCKKTCKNIKPTSCSRWLVKEKCSYRNVAVLCNNGCVVSEDDTIEVLEPESDWVISNYDLYSNGRPSITQRAVDPEYGVRWDKYSDDSYNVFYNDDNGRVSTTVNTERGLQNEFEYHDNGSVSINASHVSWEDNIYDYYVDNFREDGKPNRHIYKTAPDTYKVNVYDYNDSSVQINYIRNLEATDKDKELYNKYFK